MKSLTESVSNYQYFEFLEQLGYINLLKNRHHGFKRRAYDFLSHIGIDLYKFEAKRIARGLQTQLAEFEADAARIENIIHGNNEDSDQGGLRGLITEKRKEARMFCHSYLGIRKLADEYEDKISHLTEKIQQLKQDSHPAYSLEVENLSDQRESLSQEIKGVYADMGRVSRKLDQLDNSITVKQDLLNMNESFLNIKRQKIDD